MSDDTWFWLDGMDKALDQVGENVADVGLDDAALDPVVYLECFLSGAGQLVLEDLKRRFVTVTRWNPHEDPSTGYYREGMAQVVFEIERQMKLAEERKDNG